MSYIPSEKRPRIDIYQNQTLKQCGESLYSEIESIISGQEVDCPKVDVYFAFEKDGKRIPAHKIMLAAGSEVFQSKFFRTGKNEYFCEVTGDEPGDNEVTGAAFLEFLQFFYLSEVKLSMDHIADVMKLGDYYQVGKCMDICAQFLKDRFSENGMIGFDLALLYSHDELKKFYENYFIANTQKFLKKVGFLECSEHVLKHILKMECLSCTEVELFEACMSWVRAKSGQNVLTREIVNNHLESFFSEIRFRSMTIQQFVTLADSFDSVLSTDFRNITKMIAVPDFQPNGFNKNPRQVAWDENATIKFNRFIDSTREFNNRIGWDNPSDGVETSFNTDELLVLGGFTCEKVVYIYEDEEDILQSDLAVEVTISETESRVRSPVRTMLTMKTSLKSEWNEVLLPKPILIRPGYDYNIFISSFPLAYCYPRKTLKDKVQESDVTVLFRDSLLGHSNNRGGFIQGLYFNKL